MIGKVFFKRDEFNQPVICLASDDGSLSVTYLITEELYDKWVPDTNHLPGESLSEGVVYDKPLKANLKA